MESNDKFKLKYDLKFKNLKFKISYKKNKFCRYISSFQKCHVIVI